MLVDSDLKPFDHPEFSARIRAGDQEAIQVVVQAYVGQILRAARGAGLDASRAEDVTQETFTTFIEKAGNFDGRSHVRTWVFGILYKKILEARREERRDLQMDDIDDVMEQRFDAGGSWVRPPQSVDAEVYQAEVRQWIQECLDSVPVQQRMAFTLREVEGFSTPEICKILEVSRTNLGVLLYRVRNRLRECIEAKGLRGSADAEL